MKKYIAPTLIGTVLILLSGATYYFVVQLPAKQLAEIDKEEARIVLQDKQEKERKWDECLSNAEVEYHSWWRSECKNHGFNIERGRVYSLSKGDIEENGIITCSLPTYNADRLSRWLENEKDICFRRYQK